MTDEAIIEEVRRGNTHIFSELVGRYKDKIYHMAYRFTNDPGEAQDISQEVFINVFRNLHLYNGTAKFSTWIYRICYNCCVDWNRKKPKGVRTGKEEDRAQFAGTGGDPEESCINRQRNEALRKAVNGLKEKYRTIIILFHYQGLSYEEIAEIMKLPIKTVETRLYRGRNLLRDCMHKYENGGERYEMQTSYRFDG